MARTPKDNGPEDNGKDSTENSAAAKSASVAKADAVPAVVDDKKAQDDPRDDPRKAARKSSENEAMLREVDDAVRQDQYVNFARRYGRPLLALLVIGLIGFALYLWWDSSREKKYEADSEQIISAEDSMQAGQPEEGVKSLGSLGEEGHSDGSRTVAKMLAAGAKAEQGKTKEAADLFARVASDSDAPQEMRDLALIRQVALQYETMKPAEVEARLKPLAVPGNAYFGSAGELVAMAMLEQGKKKEAGTLFGEIAKNEDVPSTVRSRSRQMAGVLGVDSITDVDKLIEEQGAANAPVPPGAQ